HGSSFIASHCLQKSQEKQQLVRTSRSCSSSSNWIWSRLWHSTQVTTAPSPVSSCQQRPQSRSWATYLMGPVTVSVPHLVHFMRDSIAPQSSGPSTPEPLSPEGRGRFRLSPRVETKTPPPGRGTGEAGKQGSRSDAARMRRRSQAKGAKW